MTVFGESKVFKLRFKDNRLKQWVLSLDNGAAISALESDYSTDMIQSLLHTLNNLGMIRSSYENAFVGTQFEKHIDYFARFSETPNQVQEDLFRLHVAIVGVGGIGSIVLQHLAALGVGEFTIIDHDNVEVSNLNRQFLFSHNDVGKNKLKVAEDKIRDLLPDATVNRILARVASPGYVRTHVSAETDMLVCAADSPPVAIRASLLEVCAERNIPIIFGTVGSNEGTWGPLLVDSRRQMKYSTRIKATGRELARGTIKNISPSIGYTNTLIGGLVAMEITRYFLNEPTQTRNRILQFDFDSLSVGTLEEIE